MEQGMIRSAEWLNRERIGAYLWIAAAANIAVLAALILTATDGVDKNGFLLGTDFISFWTSGLMLQAGGNPYDIAAHIAAQQDYFASDSGFTAFFYPPTFLPLVYPLGWLVYFPALAFWLIITSGLYFMVARAWLTRLRIQRSSALLALAFPATIVTITHGQTSFLVAALLGAGVLFLRERPIMAGICFGLATMKPQFGLLVPIVLLMTGQWRVIVSAIVTAAALALSAVLIAGPDVWQNWLATTALAQSAMDVGTVGYDKMVSPMAAVMILGGSLHLAYAVQSCVSFGLAAALAWCCRAGRYDLRLGALMLAGTPLVTPFVLDYDMTILAFPLIWLAGRESRDWEKTAILFAFAAPLFARPMAMHLSLPIMPLILLGLFAVLLRRFYSRRDPMTEST